MGIDKLEDLRDNREEILDELSKATDPKEIVYWTRQAAEVEDAISAELDRRGRIAHQQVRDRPAPPRRPGPDRLF